MTSNSSSQTGSLIQAFADGSIIQIQINPLLSDIKIRIKTLFHNSMNFLVFSHHEDVKCCVMIDESHLLLVASSGLAIFNLGIAKIEKCIEFQNQSPVFCPIAVFESGSENGFFTIQGKMNVNLIYKVSSQDSSIQFVAAYYTGICGFVPMIHTKYELNQQITEVLISVNDEKGSIDCIRMKNGKKIGAFFMDQKKLCESVSCMVEESTSNGVIQQIFLCQQGCTISRHILDYSSFHSLKQNNEANSDGESGLKTKDQIQIPCKGDILIIKALVAFKTKGNCQLACAVRLQPRIYIINKNPKMQILNRIEVSPQHNMISHIHIDSKKQSIVVAANNSLLLLVHGKILQKEELKQSKNISSMHVHSNHLGVFVGCSCQSQFYYWQP